MNEEPIDLETRIHALLCNSLNERQRCEVLESIAHDDQARRLLGEMLLCQSRSRAAFGYDLAEAAIGQRMPAVRAALHGRDAEDAGSAPSLTGGRWWRRVLRPEWFWRAAAVAVVAACICVAISTRQANLALQRRLDGFDRRELAFTKVTSQDLAKYRRLWRETVHPGDRTFPWILIRGDVGRFGYLQDGNGLRPKRLLLLRCSVVSGDGSTLEEMNLLLLQDRSVTLPLGQSQALGGRALRYRVSSKADVVGMDLQVGPDSANSVGVRGRVAVGSKPTEIGQFKLGSRNVRVLMQAIPLGGVG